jgi:beta-lactam-binding protein with PASTA domain/predicted Ser/Thr protein kinase
VADIATDTVVDDRYRVLERVGSGGMADVYCAEDGQLGRKVALKLLHRRFASDREFVERFKREARSAAGLQHPNVVGVYDRGEWDGTSYIAMEFLDGQNLKELIRSEAPLPPKRAIEITVQILKAARFAHRRGVIHRDLKPHNVIVDHDGRVKVTDFGIARAGASDMTETGSILGTAQYLSPEQAQGHAVSARSDLYSIGVILYELLTGRLPFEADSAVSIALKHVTEDPVPPRQHNPAIPPELENVVLWALEKAPERRPTDADAFLAALEDARAHLATGTGAATTAFAVPVGTNGDSGAIYPVDPLEEEDPEAAERRRRRKRWALIALLVALLLGGLVAAYALTQPEKVLVPNEVGQTIVVAQTRLQNQGFQVDVIRRTSVQRKDEVIGQSPNPGEEVEKGHTVTLTVSDGPGEGVVPDVAGFSRERAVAAVRKAGFRPRLDQQSSDSVAAGRAIGTEPVAGSQLDKGRAVKILISTGAQQVTVPDVTGQGRDSAHAELSAAGFPVTDAEQESSAPPGTVLSQSPGGGTSVTKGTTVRLVIATAKPEAAAKAEDKATPFPVDDRVSVPNVTGQDRDAAVSALDGAGLRSSVSTKKVDSADQDGKVLSQSPGGGSKLKRGGAVKLVVGSFEPDVDPNEQPPGGATPTTPASPGATP